MFESLCLQMSSTRNKGKQLRSPEQIRDELIEAAAEIIDRDDEVLEAMLYTNVNYLKAAVQKFTENNDLACYALHGRRLDYKSTASKRNNIEPLISTEWDQRLYLYTGTTTKEKASQMVVRPAFEIPATVLKTDPKRTPFEFTIPR